MPRLLSIREPVDLPQALDLCFKLKNMGYRAQYTNSSNFHSRKAHNITTSPVPLRKVMANPARPVPIPASRREFNPELLHNPQDHQHPRFHSQVNQRPQRDKNYNKPPRGPVAMDVDQSIRSHAVNYAKRPQNLQCLQKHPQQLSQRHHQPPKVQRVYYTEPNEDTEVTQEQYQED